MKKIPMFQKIWDFKNSVPEYIKSNPQLMNKINEIVDADISDFLVFLYSLKIIK